MKAKMRCCNLHWVEVVIKTFKGRKYWICPLCNIVHGLPTQEGLAFTGHGDREWMLALERKLKGGNQDGKIKRR